MHPTLVRLKKRAGKFKRRTGFLIREKIAAVIDRIIAGKKPPTTDTSPKVFIAISTTKGYADKTVPALLEKLDKMGVSRDIIYVFEGGYTEKKMLNAEGYHHYQLDNNSFDITALIGIVELDIKKDHWLLLHDTVSFLPSFKNLLNSIDPNGYDCMPLRGSPSMNIGIYSKEYLDRNQAYLLGFSNKDYSKEGLADTKRKAFEGEDYLFNITTVKKNIHTHLAKYEYLKVSKYFNEMRLLEGYPQLGLLKFKANASVMVMNDFPELELPMYDSKTLERNSWRIELKG